MAALIRIIIAVLFFSFLWSAGSLADNLTSTERSGIFSVLGFVPIVALWLLALVLSLLPAIAIYAPELNSRIRSHLFRFLAVWNPSKFQTIYYVALSYAMTIYLFSTIFKAISNLDKSAFHPAFESLGSAAYFSVVTIATVGYGDILPVSGWARFMASAEILTGIAYGVFFLSIIASFLRDD